MRTRAIGLLVTGAIVVAAGGLLMTRYGEGSHTYFAGPGIFLMPIGGVLLLAGVILFLANRQSP